MAYLSSDTKDLLHKCRKIIDVLRINGLSDKNTIVTETKLSWATVNSYLDELLKVEIIEQVDNLYSLNVDYVFMAGISVGVTEIKVSIINLGFSTSKTTRKLTKQLIATYIKKGLSLNNKDDYICMKTPTNHISCCDICSSIVSGIIEVFSSNVQLMSIGVSVPGLIDKDSRNIDFSPNMPWIDNTNAYLLVSDNLISELQSNGCLFDIYHDMDAVSVYEMENFLKNNDKSIKNAKDVLCLFMSYGIGSTLIKNSSLRLFSSSEHGHIMTSIPEQKSLDGQYMHLCSCGHDCLENQIRHKVFDSHNIYEFTNNTTFEKLTNMETEKYNLLRNYLGFLFNHIVNTMRVDTIIISGRILNTNEKLKFDMKSICTTNTIRTLSKKCVILQGSSRLDLAAVGAAMISYYNYTSKQEANNLLISW